LIAELQIDIAKSGGYYDICENFGILTLQSLSLNSQRTRPAGNPESQSRRGKARQKTKRRACEDEDATDLEICN